MLALIDVCAALFVRVCASPLFARACALCSGMKGRGKGEGKRHSGPSPVAFVVDSVSFSCCSKFSKPPPLLLEEWRRPDGFGRKTIQQNECGVFLLADFSRLGKEDGRVVRWRGRVSVRTRRCRASGLPPSIPRHAWCNLSSRLELLGAVMCTGALLL
jgi:hypothetical protein